MVSADGKTTGSATVVDLHNGLYEVSYSAPTAGKYHVNILHADLGAPDMVPIRGSPFTVDCQDPWTKHRAVGAAPARRKGACMLPIGQELAVYGGDKSGVAVCTTGSGDWRWSTGVDAGVVPDRVNHAAVGTTSQVLVVGGTGLADNNELCDMCCLTRGPEGWSWRRPEVQALAKGRAGAAVVVLEGQVLAIGGENSGDLVPELLALVDMSQNQVRRSSAGLAASICDSPASICEPAATATATASIAGTVR